MNKYHAIYQLETNAKMKIGSILSLSQQPLQRILGQITAIHNNCLLEKTNSSKGDEIIPMLEDMGKQVDELYDLLEILRLITVDLPDNT
jgi:hypothetical protein